MTAQWVTVAQAAKAAGVHRVTVHRWITAGRVHKVGTGRYARVQLAEVLNADRDARADHGKGRKKPPVDTL